jgi:hypothetical protein
MHMTVLEAIGVGLGFLAIVAPDFWPKMPRPLSYILAGIGLAWLTYSLILGVEELTGGKLQYGPRVLMILAAILFAGGLFWHISRIGNAGKETSNGSVSPEGSLFVSCELTFLPAAMPTDGRLSVVYLSPQGIASAAGKLLISDRTGAPGSKIVWPKSLLGDLPQGWRCEITNDGSEALLEVSIPFEIAFGAGQSIIIGQPDQNRTYQLILTRLDPGPANRRVIYLFNQTADGGIGAVLDVGNAYRVGHPQRHSIRIEQPIDGLKRMLFLMPLMPVPSEEKKSDSPTGGTSNTNALPKN